jgi:ribosome-binding protein aMBF1 (putative translation factor)
LESCSYQPSDKPTQPVKQYQNYKNIDEIEIGSIKTYGIEYGKRVSTARLEKKMTQAELAKKMNYDVSIIRDVENGKGKLEGAVCNKIYQYSWRKKKLKNVNFLI